jgi:hypothetical protein
VGISNHWVCIRVWGWFGGGLLVAVFNGAGGVKD